MTNTIVSIIIPTFNRAHIIGETLDSLLQQDYQNWECFIVDDGSSDNTEELLQEYCRKDKRFQFYKRPNSLPKGGNVCRNYGLKLSKGEYIQFFDSDDIMKPNFLNGRISTFLNSEVDLLVFGCGLIKDGEIVEEQLPVTTVGNWEEALEHFLGPQKLPWNLQTAIFKASSIKGQILFNEKLTRFQDIEFNIRMLATLKPTFKVIPEVDCYYRLATGSNSKTSQFFINVFTSVPLYYECLSDVLEKKIFDRHIYDFQNWIFNLTSLYTNKYVSFKLYLYAIKSAKKFVNINIFQFIILIKLFILKKYFKRIKGHIIVFDFLKATYQKMA